MTPFKGLKNVRRCWKSVVGVPNPRLAFRQPQRLKNRDQGVGQKGFKN